MNKVTMTLAPLYDAVAESGKPLQTITLTLMGYVVQGTGAAAQTYPYIQSTPATVWTVAHNLNRFPSVTVADPLGRVVVGDVEYLDKNVVRITHGAPITGYAYLN